MNAAVAVIGAFRSRRLALQVAIGAGTVTLTALCLMGLSLILEAGATAPPPRSPFGIGFREAQPVATGLSGWLLSLQSGFSRSMHAGIVATRDGGFGPMILLGLSYGVFHAAGPGHGKAVIAGYIIAGEGALRRGLTLSFAAALLQALVAIAIVGVGTYLIGVTAAGMTRAGIAIEMTSFVLIAMLGLVLTWRKAGGLTALITNTSHSRCEPRCGHVHLNDPATISRLGTWREQVAVVIAAGSRPCTGAVLLLVFSTSQGMIVTGIVATLAMALGTALTTGALASLAVFAKEFALRLAGGRGQIGAVTVKGLEVMAASVVLVLGIAMLLGLVAASGG